MLFRSDFRIDFTFQGEAHSYSGRQDFGDRDGSLIEHIRGYQEFYLHDEQWKNHVLKYQGPEALAEDQASRETFVSEIIPYMELHCNLSRLEQEAQTRLASGDTLTPEETAYYEALSNYAKECRPLLNQGEPLPEMPQLSDFDPSIEAYREQVMAEIEQEAADAGMTVEEYAAAGYEAPAQETAPEQGDSFSIYQVPAGPEGRDFRFRSYEELQAAGLTVDRKNYALVYTAPLDGKTTLENIYRTFNTDDRPADFRGHSLSVSDVVVINRGGKEEAHYCDSTGFTPVPEFIQESHIKTAEMSTEQNYNMIDGTLNNAPSMGELEARAKAEKPKQNRTASKTAQRQKKPSIRAQLKAAKEEQAKKPPQREKSKELEV